MFRRERRERNLGWSEISSTLVPLLYFLSSKELTNLQKKKIQISGTKQNKTDPLERTHNKKGI